MTSGQTHIDLADIQGDILRAYGNRYRHTRYAFATLADPAGGRAWLGELVDRVTNAELWEPGWWPDSTLNVAVTYAGLEALGVPDDVLASFPSTFREGMAARARQLGDVGASAPAHWEDGLGTGAAHVLVTINALTREHLDAALASLQAGVEAADGVSIVHEQPAELLSDTREHFGFKDGFSQPAIEGVLRPHELHKVRGGGVPLANGAWRPLALGEFIFGYEDEDSLVDPERRLPRAPKKLGQSGTFMVYRKLEQDVLAFRTMLREEAARLSGGNGSSGVSPELLAAKMVGRWPNGTPLVKNDKAPGPELDVRALTTANDFRYLDEDADGMRCPLGAHIRRSNPRDALGWKGLDDAGLLSFRHRIIRRGMPYGPPLPADATTNGPDGRGLVFVCFNASISRQFEGIQLQWLNDGNAMHLAHDRDFLLGGEGGTGKMTLQGKPPRFLAPERPLVTTKGGEYLFVPGIAALRTLARGL